MLAGVLITIALKVTCVLLAAWLVTLAMRRSSAALRHHVWTLAFVAVLSLPVVQFAGPRWDLPVLPAAEMGSDPGDEATQPLDTPRDGGLAPATEAEAPVIAAPAAHLPSPSPPLPDVNWPRVVMAIGLAGAVFALLRLAVGLLWVNWICRRGTTVTDPSWLGALDEAAAALRVSEPVTLKSSARTTIPVACGIWRPTILLPSDAADWPDDRRRVVLLHEMAHVARRDCLVQVVAQLARAVYWFNPLAHLAIARLRAEQERACDDLVLAAGTDAPEYADHLVEIATSFRSARFPAWAALAVARPSQLEGRVVAILDGRRNRRPPAARIRAAAAALAAAFLLPVGVLGLTAAAPATLPSAPTPLAEGGGAVVDMPDEADVPDVTHEADPPDQADLPRQSDVGVVVNTAAAIVDMVQGFDFDFDFNVGEWPPVKVFAIPDVHPNPNPDPNPDPDVDPDPNPNPSQASRDAGVSDETRRRVTDALMTALNDENADVREQALAALAGMRDPRIIPALLKALGDPSVDLRERAVHSLARFDTPEAIDGIFRALKDSSPDVREHAALYMGTLGARGRLSDPKYLAALSGLIKDADPDVREKAVLSVGQMRQRESVAALLPALKDTSKEVREKAAVALGLIGDPGAIDALTAALKDADPEVREKAAQALGRIARGERRSNRRKALRAPRRKW
jgi:beta-lactamase regulating signal transducer with metallopeptidase domain